MTLRREVDSDWARYDRQRWLAAMQANKRLSDGLCAANRLIGWLSVFLLLTSLALGWALWEVW